MAFYGKLFLHERDENFEDFVKALGTRLFFKKILIVGIPKARSKTLLQYKPTQKIEKNGDDNAITITITSGEKVYKLKSGVEFDDTFRDLKVKITANVAGNKVKLVMKFEVGFTVTVNNEYTDDSFTEELTHSGWDGVARRFYKAQ